MAFYKYFWDLSSSTTYTTHTIGSFDANCTTGSGTFRWVPFVNNTSITNIPGIRIKPTAQSTGYWERVFDGAVNVGWFGCQNTTSTPSTFASLGVSQATLDARYGAGFATTADYYDNTAIRYALYMMGSSAGYQSLNFEAKTYWLSRSCELPVTYATGGNPRNMFIIDGNGANIRKVGVDQFDYFRRVPSTNTDAVNIYINTGFTFKNFKADGSGGTWQSSGYSFLFLGATYGSIIENIFLQNFDNGIRLEFCMGANVTNIFTNNIKSYSLWIKPGSWTGAALTNASSNVCEVSHIRVFDSINQIAGIAILDSDTSVIRQCIVEGTGTPQYGILLDSLNSTVAPNGVIEDCHIETVCTKGAVYVKPRSSTSINVNNIYVQYAQNIVAMEAAAFPSSAYPKVVINNIPYWPTGSTFLNIGTGNKWDLSNVQINSYLTSNTQIVSPSSTSVVSSASGSGSLMTYTTAAPHSFVAGQRVTVTGLTPTTYNVTNGVITSVGSSTFTVAGTETAASSGTGSATQGQLWDTTTANGTIPSSGNVRWTTPL